MSFPDAGLYESYDPSQRTPRPWFPYSPRYSLSTARGHLPPPTPPFVFFAFISESFLSAVTERHQVSETKKNSESMWQIRSRFQGSPIVSSRERNMQSRQSSDCLASLWNSASWLRLQCDISVIWANVDEVSQTWEEAESTSCPFEISGPNNV